jgi:hypothetical protein
MSQRFLHVELGTDNYLLKFKIMDTPLADLWIERMHLRDSWPLDHPDRFYNFDSESQERDRAANMIQNCVAIINAHRPIVERKFTSIHDQDYLNYLHHIFEVYHGLLDQQTHEFWQSAPDSVRRALAELNLAVHRCETVGRSNHPRFVCTWFGMPKTKHLPVDLMHQYGEANPAWGSVCLNYVEIGKTLEDLNQDQDRYIDDDAFKPFDFYSADFVVRFFDLTENEVVDKAINMLNYFDQHRDFFCSRGYNSATDVALAPLKFPVAQLIETVPRTQLLQDIAQRQFVTRVTICETSDHSNS